MKKHFLGIGLCALLTGCAAIPAPTYQKIHVHADLNWDLDEAAIVGEDVFQTIGAGVMEVDMIFPAEGGGVVSQEGYAYLTYYDYYASPCVVNIPAEYMDSEGATRSVFAFASIEGGNTLNIDSVNYSDPLINTTMNCGAQDVSIPDGFAFYKLFGVFNSNTEEGFGGFAFVLPGDGEAREIDTSSYPFSFGDDGAFIGSASFIITNLGEYTEEELQAMGQL